MPFPERLLNEGEEVVLDLRPHWWYMAGPAAAVVLAFALALFVLGRDTPQGVDVASAVPLLPAVIWFLGRFARWWTTNFVVTTDRLIYRRGVVAKHGREIPLDRVNDITFAQSLFERLIGAGDLMIESGGERGQQHFTDIRSPAHVQNEIYRVIELAQARDAERAAGGRELSIAEQLEKLDMLRRRGALTQAEFDSQKTKLLGR